ncbi:MAG: hypothetical protein Q8K13_10435 [Parvibaculum sp.]|uniref:hypothetical protein n=1 Tax=Parvibaculum sp. TaxID=2024848 RepID=UPI00273088FB|nr:hypothetical protein [Parvibaculum sp.]MDP2150045.1 hypothetical protein [Parvibaculum sp.]
MTADLEQDLEQARLVGSLLAHLEIAAIAMEQARDMMKAEGFPKRDWDGLDRAAARARALVVEQQKKIAEALGRRCDAAHAARVEEQKLKIADAVASLDIEVTA